MKKILILFLLILTTVVVVAQEATQSKVEDFAIIQWNATSHHFGTVKQNEPAGFEFKVTNLGTIPLQIYSVERSCGCTTPVWTSTPIAPGESGMVKVVYDAKTIGHFNKTITITANTKEGRIQLVLSGEVVAPAL